jgi:hypothetical protein
MICAFPFEIITMVVSLLRRVNGRPEEATVPRLKSASPKFLARMPGKVIL